MSEDNAMILGDMRLPNDTRRKNGTAISAAAPFCALQFPNKIIDEVGSDKLFRFVNRMGTSRLPKPAPRRLAARIKSGPLPTTSIVPFQIGKWRKLIPRLGRAESLQLQEWVPVPNSMAARLARTPLRLSANQMGRIQRPI